MTRRAWIEVGLAVGLLTAAFLLGLYAGSSHESAKAVATQQQADQHEGAAKDQAAQAAASDGQARENSSAVHAADTRAVAAKRGLDNALAALTHKTPASYRTAPDLPGVPDNADLALTRAALVQAQAVIAAQDQQIKTRDALIASLTASRDHWKAAYGESQQALRLQQIASEAAIRSERATAWKRFGQGLGLGVLAALAAHH